MTVQRVEFTAEQRALIEAWQRTAMWYGWHVGRLGLPTAPDPLFSWRDDIPEVVADGSVPASWTQDSS